MRVLAAKFPDRRHATAALGRLHRQFALRATDVGIAPLAGDQDEDDDTLLAGRFPDDRMAEVDRLIREAGGEIVADVDERWTRPRVVQRRPDPEHRIAALRH